MVCLRFCILFDKRKTKCIIRLLSRVVDHVFVHKRQKDAKDFCEAAAIAVFLRVCFLYLYLVLNSYWHRRVSWCKDRYISLLLHYNNLTPTKLRTVQIFVKLLYLLLPVR